MKKSIGTIVFVFLVIIIGIFLVNSVKQGGIKQFVSLEKSTSSVFSFFKSGTGYKPSIPQVYTKTPPQAQISAPQVYQSTSTSGNSPYFGKVRVSSVSAYNYGLGGQTQISLYPSFYNNNEKVDISSWKLKGNQRELIIPQAVGIYEPSGFTADSDIVLGSGQYVTIYSSASPLGRNLRLNRCIGYLNNIYGFNPQLPNNCPYIPRPDYSYLQGSCQSYISSLGSCETPSPSKTNLLSNECRDFLQNVNYASCYNKHFSDTDFLSSEWRIWAGENILDPNHDDIRLYDKAGLLVNEYQY